MMLSQALQYPFRGKGSFRSLLFLTLVQPLPVLGQVMLLGYGFDLKKPALTAMLLLNILLLDGITVLATSVGLVLFLLPGLFALVVCSLAFWYLLAQYRQRLGRDQPDVSFANSPTALA